jgi:hypothetical protein
MPTHKLFHMRGLALPSGPPTQPQRARGPTSALESPPSALPSVSWVASPAALANCVCAPVCPWPAAAGSPNVLPDRPARARAAPAGSRLLVPVHPIHRSVFISAPIVLIRL